MRGTVLVAAVALAGLAGASPPARLLSLSDAIHLALQGNVDVIASASRQREAEGARERQKALLLPRLFGAAYANRQKRNLEVFGIPLPGEQTVVGPFWSYDARLYFDQKLFDLQAIRALRGSESLELAAGLRTDDARSLSILRTVTFYLGAQAAAARQEAASSRVARSRALARLAEDQHRAGLATRIDVVRAQLQVKRDEYTLLVSKNDFSKAVISLARYLGLEPGAPVELSECLEYRRAEPPAIEEALPAALLARPDYQSLLAQLHAADEQLQASRARAFPKLALSGDYGAIGLTIRSMPVVGEIQGTMTINLFDHDRTGERIELEGQIRRLQAEADDTRRGIEQDIRETVLDLNSTDDGVRVSQDALALARQEMTLAEDRFRSGVTDNTEVINAQDSLARAEDENIEAITSHVIACAAVARALGSTEEGYLRLLGVP
jgi:outer membrane protein TolC